MKKLHEEPETSGESKGERWLLTYSDMITLLMVLFIILYSMSTIEAKKLQAVSENFGNAFHSKRTAKSTIGNSDAKSGVNSDGESEKSIIASEEVTNSLDEIYKALSIYVNDNHLEGEIEIIATDTFVRIQLKDKLMFVPNSEVLLENSLPIINEIGSAILGIYEIVDHITISGHTASVGSQSPEADAFSWNLSINRADTVRKRLVECGLKDEKLSLEGYGNNKPVASNETEEGRAKNRRVEISVYKYSSSPTGSND